MVSGAAMPKPLAWNVHVAAPPTALTPAKVNFRCVKSFKKASFSELWGKVTFLRYLLQHTVRLSNTFSAGERILTPPTAFLRHVDHSSQYTIHNQLEVQFRQQPRSTKQNQQNQAIQGLTQWEDEIGGRSSRQGLCCGPGCHHRIPCSGAPSGRHSEPPRAVAGVLHRCVQAGGQGTRRKRQGPRAGHGDLGVDRLDGEGRDGHGEIYPHGPASVGTPAGDVSNLVVGEGVGVTLGCGARISGLTFRTHRSTSRL